MADFQNLDDFAEWAQHRSHMGGSLVSVRAALRALPAISKDIDFNRRGKDWRNPDLAANLLTAFRKLAVNWVLVKYPYRFPDLDRFAKIANEDVFIMNAGAVTASHFTFESINKSLSAFVSGNFRDFMLAVEYSNQAITLANVEPSEALNALTADASRMEEFLANNIADSPIWLRGNPAPLIRAWNSIRSFFVAHNENWQVWTDWYSARRDGRRVWRQSIEFARLTLDNKEFWQSGHQSVNTELQRIIDVEKAKFRERFKTDPSSEAAIVLAQRPSSHSFSWRSKAIEALPVSEAPFDAVLASAIIGELREKSALIIDSLVGNHADIIVISAIKRSIDTLSLAVDQIPEGILLMRANSIAAHAKSYLDAGTERERTIKALLDDFSSSMANLVDCYPGIRQINANRLALDLQAETASDVEEKLSEISKIAELSPVVGNTAKRALKVGQNELSEFSSKIDSGADLDRAASYIHAKGQTIAARLLDATNFVSATIVRLTSELGEMSEETWRETRKVLPKSVARGISSGVQAGLQYGSETLLLLLATHIAGPWGGIAMLVPRLAPHSKKINQVLRDAEEISSSEE